jgi:iron complex outermembrane receptor protein
MMKETIMSRSLRGIFSGSLAIGLGIFASTVAAQDSANIQRVEVTGSSIKRINEEGSVPIQVITSADIAKSGAQNVEDLVQALPAMQGFLTSSVSVNGGGGGVQNASIHGIGSGYTLVLLNGRRMAPYSAGSAVNLSSIPLAAVERIEVLTDGVGAVRRRRHRRRGQLRAEEKPAGLHRRRHLHLTGKIGRPQQQRRLLQRFRRPRHGRLQRAGFLQPRRPKRPNASQRDFAKSGLVRFSENGKQYSLYHWRSTPRRPRSR